MQILAYHTIKGTNDKDIPEDREIGADLYDVKIFDFKDQLKAIKEKNLNVSTNVFDRSNTDIVITFDDGEKNNATEAFPALQDYGYKAYFFIIANRVGRQGYASWEDLKEMHDCGMVIGSHGLSHEILTSLKETQIEEELRSSKRVLERNLNIEVDTISIPRGFCNHKILEMAYSSGYKIIFVSDPIKKTSLNSYPRTAVKATWKIKRFKLAIDGKTPVQEIISKKSKQTLKFILREKGYNFLRDNILGIGRNM